MDVMTLSARLTLDTKDFERGLRRSEGKMKKAGKGIDSDTKGFSAKAVALGTFAGNMLSKVAEKAIGAITSIISKSVEAFADYEQLVGGVSTLFGQRDIKNAKDYAKQIGLVEEKVDRAGRTVTKVNKKMAKGLWGKDANKMSPDEMIERVYQEAGEAENLVFENANQAYKTAGMSMNHYMEVATSFASSMVQSLKGDTLEAARLTDMAVRDMADNANKMGTDLGSIENAYKGFAKGNFTMLDNLKLGYGGTRKEMERLLKDAQAITGEKYDINNMGDVTRAIHVIQQKKGITGTTEREAEQTIAGSKLMLQAAWENVLVALAAPEDLDLSGAISSLTESAKTYLNNIFPVVSQVVSGLGDFMQQILPDVMEKLPELIADFAPKLWEAAKGMVAGLGKGIVKAFKKIKWPTWQDIRTGFQNMWKKVQNGASNIMKFIFGKTSDGGIKWPTGAEIGQKVSGAISTMWKGVQDVAKDLMKLIFGETEDGGIKWPTMDEIAGAIGTAFKEYWGYVQSYASGIMKLIFGEDENGGIKWPTTEEIAQKVSAGISTMWEGVKNAASGIMKLIFGEDENGGIDWPDQEEIASKVESGLRTLWSGIQSVANSIMTLIFGGAEGGGIDWGDGGQIWEGVKAAFSKMWDFIAGAATGIMRFIFGTNEDGGIDWPTGEEIWAKVSEKFTEMWNGIKAGAGVIMKLIFGETADGGIAWPTAGDVWGKIKDYFSKMWDGIAFSAQALMKLIFGETADGGIDWPSAEEIWAKISETVSGWWTDLSTKMLEVMKWVLNLPDLPDPADIIASIAAWWQGIVSDIELKLGIELPDWMGGGKGKGNKPQISENEKRALFRYNDEAPGDDEAFSKMKTYMQEAMQRAGFAEEEINSALEALTQNRTNPAWIQEFVQQLSDGERTASTVQEVIAGLEGDHNINLNFNINGSFPQFSDPEGSHAKGLHTVPYDNYIARLHRNEMVLTASQARKYREGQNSMDTAAFAASVVAAVREGMAGASVNSYLDGKGVTDKVNRRTSNRMRARRFVTA